MTTREHGSTGPIMLLSPTTSYHAAQRQISLLGLDTGEPLVLDTVLFIDLTQRSGLGGIQEWWSFYFKSSQHTSTAHPERDLFSQQTNLKNTLGWPMGEDPLISAWNTTLTAHSASTGDRELKC